MKRTINLLNPQYQNTRSFPYQARLLSFISSVIIATIYVVYVASGANTTIGNNISTSGNLTIGGTAQLSGILNASSTLQVTGTTILYGKLAVGTTSPSQALSVQGNALISGDVTLANITATGTATLNNITFTGTCTGCSTATGNVGTSTAAGQIPFYASSGSTTLTPTSTITVSSAGNVGIGTTSPQTNFHVYGDSNQQVLLRLEQFNGGSAFLSPSIAGFTAGGSAASPTATANGDWLLFIGARGYQTDTNAYGAGSKAAIVFQALENWTSANQGAGIVFRTTANGGTATTEKARIDGSGKLGIGTTSPFALHSVNAPAGQPSFVVGSSTTQFIIDKNGVVGVGTANPTASIMHIAGSGGALRLQDTSAATNEPHIRFQGSTGATLGFVDAVGNSSDFRFTAGPGQMATIRSDNGTLGITVATTGKVGISATSTPTGTLSVEMGSDPFAFWVGDQGTSTPAMVVTGAGRVGIGTSNPQVETVQIASSLDSAGVRITQTGSDGGDFAVSSESSVNGGGFSIIDRAAGVRRMVISRRGNIQLGSADSSNPTDLAFNLTATTSAATSFLVVNRSGLVGIGTTSPTEQLSVANRLYVGGSGTSTIENNLKVLGTLQIGAGTTYLTTAGLNTSGPITLTGTTGTSTISSGQGLAVGTNQFIVIGSNGRVGIQTLVPAANLQVGDEDSDTNFNIRMTSGPSVSTVSLDFCRKTGACLSLYRIAGDDRLRIRSSGVNDFVDFNGTAQAVGIRTTNTGTGAYLTVGDHTANSGARIAIDSASSGANGLNIRSGGTDTIQLYRPGSTSNFRILVNGADRMHFDGTTGNVGIGTTSPSQTLSVHGNALFSGNISSVANITATGSLNVSGLTTLGNASTTQISSTGSAYFATSAGNVGIGATNPSSKLTIGSSSLNPTTGSILLADTAPQLFFERPAESTNNRLWDLLINGSQFQGRAINDANSVGTPWLTVSRSGTTISSVVFPNGNLGIGTTSPAQTLAVQGNALFSGNVSAANITATGSVVFSGATDGRFTSNANSISSGIAGLTSQLIDSSGTTQGRFHLAVVGTSAGHLSTTAQYDTYLTTSGVGNTYGNLLFAVGNSEKMRIASTTGNVGIGTTSPFALLSVNAPAGQASFAVGSSTTQLIVDKQGNIGVGTANPTTKLSIAKNNAIGVDTTDGSDDGFLVVSGGGGIGTVGTRGAQINLNGMERSVNAGKLELISGNETNSAATIDFYTGGQLRATINNSGNVGIGTTTPSATLNVHNVTAGSKAFALGAASGRQYSFATANDFGFGGADLRFFGGDNDNKEYLYFSRTGNVGIGTTSPSRNLDVSAAGTVGAGINSIGAAGTAFLDLNSGRQYRLQSTSGGLFHVSDETAGQFRVTMNSSGNVGIGSTSPSQTLSVQGNALFSGNITSVANITATGTLSLTGTTGTSTIASGQGFTVGSSQFVVQQGSGRVGIGTDTPQSKLHIVNGDAKIEQNSSTVSLVLNAGPSASNSNLEFQNGGVTKGYASFIGPSDVLVFNRNGIAGSGINIRSSNNVGIATSTPQFPLSVQANSGANAIQIIGRNNGTTDEGTLTFVDNDGVTQAYLQTSGSNLGIFTVDTERMRITSAGNVGIGTTSPYAKLSVTDGTGTLAFQNSSQNNLYVSGTNSTLILDSISSNFPSIIIKRSGTADAMITNINGGTGLSLYGNDTGGSAGMFINSAGNVGIGTTTPTNKLHILKGGSGVNVGTEPSLVVSDTSGINAISIISGDTSTGGIRFGKSSDAARGQVRFQHAASAVNERLEFVTSAGTSMVVDGNGNVGISTTSPSAQLSVEMGTNPFAFWVGDNGTSTPAMVVDGAGRVGIGTRIFSASDPLGAEFFKAQKDQSSTTTFVFLNDSNTNGAAAKLSLSVGGPSAGDPYMQWAIANGTRAYALGIDNDDSDKFKLNTAATSNTDLISGTNLFTITTSGNVGIGLTNPSHFLNVRGTGTASQQLLLAEVSTGADVFLVETDSGGDAKIQFAIPTGGPFFHATSANGGRIGIGTTSPTAPLHVSGSGSLVRLDGSVGNHVAMGFAKASSDKAVLGIAASANSLVTGSATDDLVIRGNTQKILFSTDGGSTALMTLTTGGNVGIGTTSPGNLLTLRSTVADSGLQLAVKNGSAALQFVNTDNADKTWSILQTQTGSGSLRFFEYDTTLAAGTGNNRLTLQNGGNVGIGTTSPGTLLALHSGSDFVNFAVTSTSTFSKGINLLGGCFAVNGTCVSGGGSGTVNNGTQGQVAFYDTTSTAVSGTSTLFISSAQNIGIGTTTPNYNLTVARKTSAFNAGQDGSLGAWSTNANALPTVNYHHSSVAANGYVYVIGGNDGSDKSTVYYAKLNSDGSTGAWSTATALPATRSDHSSVVANGYVYVLGGSSSAAAQSTVYYAKLNSDGTVGSWSTNTNALPAVRFGHSSVVANGHVYVIGGRNDSTVQSTVYYAKLNSDGSTGAWSTTTALPTAEYYHSSVAANGYVYAIGGYDGTNQFSTVYYAKLNSDGTVGSWSTNTNALPAARRNHTSIVTNGYVYVIGGNGAGAQSTIYYAKLNLDGSLGGWFTNANALPTVSIAHSTIIANGYVYVLGGFNNIATIYSTVYYSSTARVFLAGDLDLLGLASTTLADINASDAGSVGSSIYAGNIFSQGRLEVMNGTQLVGGVGIEGLLSIRATTSGIQTGQIFSIQNATGTAPIMTALYNGNVGIGTSTPGAKLNIIGALCVDDTSPTCANAARTDGTVYAVNAFSATLDLAEAYPTHDETLEAGDLVMMDENNPVFVARADATKSDLLLGAISTKPGFYLGGFNDELYVNNKKVPLALSGRIPVKVNLEGGEIRVGDPITISSVPGVGKKATASGKIIGYALENFTAPTIENDGKVMVFVSLKDHVVSVSESTSPTLLAQVIDIVKSWLESMEVFIENGLVKVKSLVAETLVGKKVVTDAFELKDSATGETYCVRITNGEWDKMRGECSPTTTTFNESSSQLDTEPPVITLNGPSSIELEKGTQWSDPGATVTDNVNPNLGLSYQVNGTNTGNEGRDLPTIDTNIPGTSTITYTATDEAGNISSQTRTVVVKEPTSSTTSDTTESTETASSETSSTPATQ